jgi:hypothetical protein
LKGGDACVISGLTTKRAQVSGIMAGLEKRIAQHRADLVHIGAVLRLYAPEVEPGSIVPKDLRKRNDGFKPRRVVPHDAGHPERCPARLASRDIAAEVMQRRRLDAGDARTAHLVGKLVNSACRDRRRAW